MYKALCFILSLIFFAPSVEAYKVYFYNEKGERVYKTIEQKDFAKYKNAPRRTFIRYPRKNWEITDGMRARKMTSSQYTHRK